MALISYVVGYEKDDEMCKTRISTLTSAYRNYLHGKRNKLDLLHPKSLQALMNLIRV